MGLAIRSCAGLAVIWTTKQKFFWISPKVGQKHRLSLREDLFFFWRPPNSGQKKRFNFSEDLFFGDHLSLDNKATQTNQRSIKIWVKIV